MNHGLALAWKTVVKMMDGFFALLPNLLIALIVFFIFNAIGRVLRNLTFQLTSHAKFDKTLSNALGKLAAVFINVFGILVCASIVVPTFTPDKLIAGLGITSVAIGFAFQNILQNFFAGVLLLWQKPFVIGDEIKCKDYEGTVEDIEIRTTLLRTYSGERVYIPNGMLFTDPVTVNTAFATRQIRMQIPSGKVPPETAVKLAKKAISDIDSLSKDKQPEVYASSQTGGTVVEIYAWSAPQNAKVIRAKNEVMFAVQRELDLFNQAQEKDQEKSKVA